MKYFFSCATERTAQDLTGIHHNKAIRFFHKLREKIALKQQNRIEQFCGKIEPDRIVYKDFWRGYNTLDISEFKHYRINHSEFLAQKYNHINGIENF